MLAYESIYQSNMNADVEETIKSCHTCLDHQATCPKDKVLSHEIPGRPWESVGADIFTITYKPCLSIIEYCSIFLDVK